MVKRAKRLYKLTDENGRTRGGTQWGPGVTHRATGDPGQGLCSDGWIHAYENPYVAVLMNPIHGNFSKPIMYLARGVVGKRDDWRKCGCRKLTTIKQIELPVLSIEQRVAIAILAAWERGDKKWKRWARRWLNGEDRTVEAAAAAWAAAEAARAAAEAARAAAWAAAACARGAACAGEVSADMTRTVNRKTIHSIINRVVKAGPKAIIEMKG